MGGQVGGAIGLALIGTVAWTVVSNDVRHAIRHVAGASAAIARPGGPVYDHALTSGVSDALAIGAGTALLALVITVVTIRIRRADLPSAPPVI